MSDCRTFKDLIEEHLDGTINEERLEELKAHMAACGACAEEFKRSALMQEVIADAFEPRTAVKDAADGIVAHLPGPPVRVRRAGVWMVRARFAAAAAILVVAGLIAGFVAGKAGSIPTTGTPLTEVPMRVAGLDGTVLVRHEGSEVWQVLRSDSAVYLGDTFHCAGGAGLTLELEDGKSTVELAENSMLALKTYDTETRLFLEQGHCRASLESPHPPFFIETPHGRAEALGTVFSVTVK